MDEDLTLSRSGVLQTRADSAAGVEDDAGSGWFGRRSGRGRALLPSLRSWQPREGEALRLQPVSGPRLKGSAVANGNHRTDGREGGGASTSTYGPVFLDAREQVGSMGRTGYA